MLEAGAGRGQGVNIGCLYLAVAVTAEMIGAQSVNRDEEQVDRCGGAWAGSSRGNGCKNQAKSRQAEYAGHTCNRAQNTERISKPGDQAKGEQSIETRVWAGSRSVCADPKGCRYEPGRIWGRQLAGFVRPFATEKRRKLFHNPCRKRLPFLPLRPWGSSITPSDRPFPLAIFL